MRVYLSGPITGKPDYNVAAFDAAAKRMRGEGHFVIIPHELTPLFGTVEEIDNSFKAYYEGAAQTYPNGSYRLARAVMDADLAAVHSCDVIYLLRGWENSRGAKKELAEAIKYGLKIMHEGAEK